MKRDVGTQTKIKSSKWNQHQKKNTKKGRLNMSVLFTGASHANKKYTSASVIILPPILRTKVFGNFTNLLTKYRSDQKSFEVCLHFQVSSYPVRGWQPFSTLYTRSQISSCMNRRLLYTVPQIHSHNLLAVCACDIRKRHVAVSVMCFMLCIYLRLRITWWSANFVPL